MCPACLLSAAMLLGGATTAGGATALLLKGVRNRRRMPAPETLQRHADRRHDGKSESHGG